MTGEATREVTRQDRIYCLKANSDYHRELCEECRFYPNCDHMTQDDMTELTIKDLETLEQEHKWIPVTEGLPEEGTFVLASYNSDEGPDVVMTYYNKYGFTRGLMTAWMPLPQPYKAESEDKE